MNTHPDACAARRVVMHDTLGNIKIVDCENLERAAAIVRSLQVEEGTKAAICWRDYPDVIDVVVEYQGENKRWCRLKDYPMREDCEPKQTKNLNLL